MVSKEGECEVVGQAGRGCDSEERGGLIIIQVVNSRTGQRVVERLPLVTVQSS